MGWSCMHNGESDFLLFPFLRLNRLIYGGLYLLVVLNMDSLAHMHALGLISFKCVCK
jgi:hypothetical protein